MTIGQVPKMAKQFSLWPVCRASLAVAFAVLVGGVPTPLTAAIDRDEAQVSAGPLEFWTVAQSTAPQGGAVVPPVKREPPQAVPEAGPEAGPEAAPTPAVAPSAPAVASPELAAETPQAETAPSVGIFSTIQEWLARANREYQGVVVKQLSLPPTPQTVDAPAADDEIAKKLKEQQAEDARKAADAKAAADSAAAAKADAAAKLDADRKRAADTKRLADETKRKADEMLKAADKQSQPKPDVAPTVTADQADDAEQQRRDAQKLTDEAKRQDQLRKTEETRRAEAERKRAATIADERTRAAAAAAEQQAAAQKHRSRTIVLVPEPIVRPVDPGTVFRPEMVAARAAVRRAERSASAYRGTAVKRWVWRAKGHSHARGCTAAGRRITPPARYTIKRGDSLWRISARHYRQGRLYPKIYSANRRSIRNPDLIYPCQRVMVPRRR